jgi:hypothetical protein
MQSLSAGEASMRFKFEFLEWTLTILTLCQISCSESLLSDKYNDSHLECGVDVQDEKFVKILNSDGVRLSGEDFDMIRLEIDGRLSEPLHPSSKGCITRSSLLGSKKILVRNKSRDNKQSTVIETIAFDFESNDTIKLSRIPQSSPKFIDSQLPPLGNTVFLANYLDPMSLAWADFYTISATLRDLKSGDSYVLEDKSFVEGGRRQNVSFLKPDSKYTITIIVNNHYDDSLHNSPAFEIYTARDLYFTINEPINKRVDYFGKSFFLVGSDDERGYSVSFGSNANLSSLDIHYCLEKVEISDLENYQDHDRPCIKENEEEKIRDWHVDGPYTVYDGFWVLRYAYSYRGTKLNKWHHTNIVVGKECTFGDFQQDLPGRTCTKILGMARFDSNLDSKIFEKMKSVSNVSNRLIFENLPDYSFDYFQNLNEVGSLVISNREKTSKFKGAFKHLKSISNDLEIEVMPGLDDLEFLRGDSKSIGGNIYIVDTPLESLRGMDSIIKIGGSLNIISCQLKSLKGLSPELTGVGMDFVVSNNEIKSLEGLEAIRWIGGELHLTYNKLETLSGLSPLLSKLQYLDISYNRLANFEGLGNLTEIVYDFKARSNFLVNLSGLNPSLQSIGRDFELGSNNLTSLKGFPPSLKKIGRIFDLSFNNLTSLEGMGQNLAEVGHFSASNNDLTSLRGMSAALNEINGSLNLAANQLTSLQGLEGIIKIKGSFDLSNNQLSSLTELDSLELVEGDFDLANNKNLSSQFLQDWLAQKSIEVGGKLVLPE